ncbi:putative membrane protein [Bacillus mesophilus]|uniref:Uncharacterized protein n=1 Tax=Bacillus mesophilus TaxID=1808955 RepID=A0A6M0Q453_9BACI|nr:hypothetical protein [Bacillus mesophilus]MBM7660268.1 putative membrane protein [Bacillus mesophilus]NEY70983.1 hypothetical protein [Bacillus mesophilus]
MDKRRNDGREWERDEDLDNDLKELMDNLEFKLDDYDVEYPSESEMMMTIESLRPYMPAKVNRWEVFAARSTSITKHALTEVYYMSPFFWIANVLFMMIAISAVILTKVNPATVIFLLAPIPTLTGLIEVIKSRNAGMAELEMSFKFNLQEVILSRMVAIGAFNLLINNMLTLIISQWNHYDILAWELMLYWVTPFTVITSIALALVTRFRQMYTVTIGIVIWMTMGSLFSHVFIVDRVPTLFYIVVTVLATGTIVIQMRNMFKRGMSYEFNH